MESQLDAHHLDPIAERQRRSQLKVVVVLCANCRRLEHSTVPPMSIGQLRQMMG